MFCIALQAELFYSSYKNKNNNKREKLVMKELIIPAIKLATTGTNLSHEHSATLRVSANGLFILYLIENC